MHVCVYVHTYTHAHINTRAWDIIGEFWEGFSKDKV